MNVGGLQCVRTAPAPPPTQLAVTADGHCLPLPTFGANAKTKPHVSTGALIRNRHTLCRVTQGEKQLTTGTDLKSDHSVAVCDDTEFSAASLVLALGLLVQNLPPPSAGKAGERKSSYKMTNKENQSSRSGQFYT